MTLFYVFAAILLFGILITVHEAGHFFAARALGIPVREFSIGFGPKLLQWKRKKHDTQFFLRSIPLGGYCAFYGEDQSSSEAKDDPRYFGKFPVWKRMLTILMGPLMNLVLAFLVAIALYGITGIPVPTGPVLTQVQTVSEGSAAQAAGLLPGDVILSLDGHEVTDNLPQLLDAHADAEQGKRTMAIKRFSGGVEEELLLEINPVYNEVEKRYMIGIVMSVGPAYHMEPGNAVQLIQHAYRLSYQAGSSVFNAIKNLVTKGQGAGEVSGVVGITKMIVDEIQRSQWEGYLYLMIVISINLGLMNLLIIPGLDGSRFLFLLVEGIRGKPIEKEGYVHAAGMILLFGLMIFITFRDIVRLF